MAAAAEPGPQVTTIEWRSFSFEQTWIYKNTEFLTDGIVEKSQLWPLRGDDLPSTLPLVYMGANCEHVFFGFGRYTHTDKNGEPQITSARLGITYAGVFQVLSLDDQPFQPLKLKFERCSDSFHQLTLSSDMNLQLFFSQGLKVHLTLEGRVRIKTK